MSRNTKPILLLSIIISGVIIIIVGSCTNEKEPQPADCDMNPVRIDQITATKATCGVSDGSITVSVSGGSGSYMYSIDGNSFQSGKTFDNLLAGNYEVMVMDTKNCTASESVSVENSSGMTISAKMTNLAGCGTEEGAVEITVSGGDPPYQYKVSSGSYQDNSTISGLPSGTITTYAKDANGCEVTAKVDVLTGTSLSMDVMPIINANCAVSGCHDGKSGIPDWSDTENVIQSASLIKQRTQNKTMPPAGRSITDDEIQTIACWVNDGAKDN